VVSLLASIAKLEREKIRERSVTGLAPPPASSWGTVSPFLIRRTCIAFRSIDLGNC
jgi:hypothetical protein